MRRITFALALLSSGALVWFGSSQLLRLSNAERGGVALDFIEVIERWRADFAADRGSQRVALVGDSMLSAPPGSANLPDRMLAIANRKAPRDARLTFHTLNWGALTMIGEYCIADEIAAAKPTLIVLELNLHAMQPGGLGAFSYAELAGWIHGDRLTEAMFVPLSDAGITLNRLLFYRFLVKNHLETMWLALVDRQTRLFNSREIVESWVERSSGVETLTSRKLASAVYYLERALVPQKNRPSPAHATAMLGAVLDGLDGHNSRLRVLEALLGDFRREHIPVLVWVSPINMQHLRSLGFSMAGLDRSLEAIGVAVRTTGATFVDLHAMLPDAAFQDAGDHYTVDGNPNGTALVAARLAPAIKRAAAAAAGPSPTAVHAVQ